MKNRYLSLLAIIILVIAAIYLWYENNEGSKSLETSHQTQVSKDTTFLTTVLMQNSIPNTFELYRDDFTEAELELFKNSLDNLNRDISLASANFEKLEEANAEARDVSQALEQLYKLFLEIHDEADQIDQATFIEMSEIIPEYGTELNELLYNAPEEVSHFKKSAQTLEEMMAEIEDML